MLWNTANPDGTVVGTLRAPNLGAAAKAAVAARLTPCWLWREDDARWRVWASGDLSGPNCRQTFEDCTKRNAGFGVE